MEYQFLEVVGLERPGDLRRAREALARHPGGLTCWIDAAEEAVWLLRPDGEVTGAEAEQAVELLGEAGYWAAVIDQRKASGPPCLALHRARRTRQIAQRLAQCVVFGVPVVAMHLFGHRLAADPAREYYWPLWMQLILSLWLLFAAGGGWIYHGLWSLGHARWRWRTAAGLVPAGLVLLGLADLLMRSAGGAGLLAPAIGPQPVNPLRSLFAPAVLTLALLLLHSLLLRRRLGRIGRPFDRWLDEPGEQRDLHLALFVRIQSYHQQADLARGPVGRADRLFDIALAFVPVLFAFTWIASGALMPGFLLSAGLLLALDRRAVHLPQRLPQLLAERRAAALGAFVADTACYASARGPRCAVLAKSGSVTTDRCQVARIALNPHVGLSLGEDELVRLAASAEHDLDHPLAEGLREESARRGLGPLPATNPRRHPGLGVTADVQGRCVRVGSERFMVTERLECGPFAESIERLKREGYSVVLVGLGESIAGAIGVIDTVRPGSVEAVAALRADGYDVRLITGDSAEAGAALAARLGIAAVAAQLDPKDKLEQLRRWRLDGPILLIGRGDKDEMILDAADLAVAIHDRPQIEQRLHEAIDLTEAGLGELGELSSAQVVVLGRRLATVPAVVRLLRGVDRRRRLGMGWMGVVTGAAVAAAVALPVIPALAEWAPAAAAAIACLGLPRAVRALHD